MTSQGSDGDAPIRAPVYAAELAPGTLVGEYRVEHKLADGGMATVYAAVHPVIGKRAAIKVISPSLCTDAEAVGRFIAEARAVNRIGHPNIVDVFGFGQLPDGRCYFFMEWLQGETLAARLAAGRLPLEQVIEIGAQLCDALAATHEQGIVHRDLKPQNILLTRGMARISDFGLAKNFQQAGLSGMSLTGAYAGTPLFMPREQIIHFKYVKPVSDVWSLGATFYHMLTGAFPYPFTEKRDPIDVILNEAVVPLADRNCSIPKPVCETIDLSLSIRPHERFVSAQEMLPALSKALNNQ